MNTVKVKIAVCVDHLGNWTAIGSSDPKKDDAKTACSFGPCRMETNMHVQFVTAEVPVPKAKVVPGEVEGDWLTWGKPGVQLQTVRATDDQDGGGST